MTYESKYAVGDVVSYTNDPSRYKPEVYYGKIESVTFEERMIFYRMSLRDTQQAYTSTIEEKFILQKFEPK